MEEKPIPPKLLRRVERYKLVFCCTTDKLASFREMADWVGESKAVEVCMWVNDIEACVYGGH